MHFRMRMKERFRLEIILKQLYFQAAWLSADFESLHFRASVWKQKRSHLPSGEDWDACKKYSCHDTRNWNIYTLAKREDFRKYRKNYSGVVRVVETHVLREHVFRCVLGKRKEWGWISPISRDCRPSSPLKNKDLKGKAFGPIFFPTEERDETLRGWGVARERCESHETRTSATLKGWLNALVLTTLLFPNEKSKNL